MKEKIGIFNTYYSLLIYLLVFDNMKIKYILTKNIDFTNIYGGGLYILDIFDSKNKILRLVSYLITLIHLKILFFNKKVEIYGQDHISIGKQMIGLGDFYLFEDGTLTYQKYDPIKINIFKKLIFKILGFKPTYGYSKNVKKIYLTGLAPVPDEIKDKVEIIDLKKLWNSKTYEQKKYILNIFDFKFDNIDILKAKEIILFTQPLSEDGVITEKRKIEIYKNILKQHPQNKIVIKTHPREKTDYKTIFKNYCILDKPFPFELLNLMDIKFKKAITLFSTAALNMDKETKIDFYGTQVDEKIYKRFGNLDNIYKRNCYLK